MDDLSGKIVSHYKILEKLGGGGMGVVYKAEDTRLRRRVALKFLPPALSHDEEANERFMQEARAASAIDHNHICTIFDIDKTDDGSLFMAMAYYEGETLKKKADSPVEVEQVISLSIQIAKGLLKAHREDIVHRDLKPANIMLTDDGIVKILDFGLAKLQGNTRLTREGSQLGTAAYMSPEQVRGETGDRRSDIWSLGVVMYQMVTGTLPFSGHYEQAVMYAILSEEPTPPTAVRSAVPMELERIILKALAKDPTKRYQHIDEMLVDLKNLESSHKGESTGSTVHISKFKKIKKPIFIGTGVLLSAIIIGIFVFPRFFTSNAMETDPGNPALQDSQLDRTLSGIPTLGRKSIAVLPFTYLAAEDSTDYFSLGITDELLTRLGQIKDLSVIGRTSVMQYQNTNKTLPEIGRELGVAHLLEGSVQVVGSKVRIQAQLIDAGNAKQLWSESYTRELEDILTLQSEVATDIARSLQAELLPGERQLLTYQFEVDENAYQLYLQAQFQRSRIDSTGLALASKLYQEALSHDSTFAPAFAGLAMTYFYSGLFGSLEFETVMREVLMAAERALSIDSTVTEAYVARALTYQFNGEWDLSGRAFRQAIRVNPNHSEALREYGFYLLRLGHIDSAFVQAQKAVGVDPRSWHAHHSLGYVYHCKKEYGKAIQELETALNLGSQNPGTYLYLNAALLMRSQELYEQGLVDEANRLLSRFRELNDSESNFSDSLDLIELAVKGEVKKTVALLEQRSPDITTKIFILLLLGQDKLALDEMEPLNYGFGQWVFSDPIFDPVRNNPRFEKIVEGGMGIDVDLQ